MSRIGKGFIMQQLADRPLNVSFNTGVAPEAAPTEIEKIQECFKQTMINAEEAYKTLGTASKEEKEILVTALEEAWKNLTQIRELSTSPLDTLKIQSQELARITFLWGQSLWANVDMEISRQAFSLSLMYARNLPDHFDSGSYTLPEYLEKLASDPHTFRALHEEFLNLPSVDSIIREAVEAGDPIASAVANAAFKLGGTYQKLSSINSTFTKEEIIALRKNSILIAETIWKKLDTKDSKWAVISSKYNTGPARYNLTHSNDPQGIIAIYKEVQAEIEDYERSEGDTSIRVHQQRAQCYNMLAIKSQGILPDAENYHNFVRAAEIAAEYADQGFDVFLARLFMHNRAAMAFKSIEKGMPFDEVNITKIQEWVNAVIEQCEKHKYSHFYDAIFTRTAAKVAFYQGNFEESRMFLNKSLEICDANPNTDVEDIREETVTVMHMQIIAAFEFIRSGRPLGIMTIDFVQERIDQLLKQCESHTFSEFKNAVYYLTAAKIAFYQGKAEEAQALISQSESHCEAPSTGLAAELESKRKAILEETLSFAKEIGVAKT
jgi:tetratricopeptide (TPR) repeat protein